MTASSVFPRTHVCCAALLGLLGAATGVAAQQATDPGNLIIERQITPRDAFVPVPKSQDPISVQVQTFPAAAFDGALGAMATDLDLNGAHGSSGVAGNGLMPSLVGANSVADVGHLLGGNSGNGVPVGAGPSVGGIGGIGSSIAQSVNGALAPLGAALGAVK